MYTSRRIDDREILLKRQQKIYFQMSGAGHEAIGVAAGLALKAGYDWFYPYYRDRALCLALGVSPTTCSCRAWAPRMIQVPAAVRCRRTGAIPRCISSPSPRPPGRRFYRQLVAPKPDGISARHPNAAGSPRIRSADYRQFKNVSFQNDEVTYVSLGDGTSSEGEFWEAMNAAALGKLAGDLLRGRQRLCDLRSRGSADRRRKYFAPGVRFPQFPF